ncbi:MAG TPA: alcohol dehydrogenase-like regulatory protein ErcA [Armatimonadota bacterium]
MSDPIALGLRKFVAPEIVYGPGALAAVRHYGANLGARRALLVTDPGVRSAGWCGQVESELRAAGTSFVVFDGVTPNPKDYEVAAGAELYLSESCDVIVAVGGGSPMDCAKAIGVVVSNEQQVDAFEGVDRIEVPGPPLICIPTTAGSSADVSQFAIITDTRRATKMAIISKALVPDVALVDPTTTRTMGPSLTAATGLDALCHALEAYASTASSPLTDLHALEAVRLVSHHLPDVVREPDNLIARDLVMRGSLMAGLAFSNASLGLVHAMAHALGGMLDSVHGECNAILLEHVVRFNYGARAAKYEQAALAIGLEVSELPVDKQGELLGQALADLRRSLGVTGTLGSMGVTLAHLPDLAARALRDPCLATNPIIPDQEDIEHVYGQAL